MEILKKFFEKLSFEKKNKQIAKKPEKLPIMQSGRLDFIGPCKTG